MKKLNLGCGPDIKKGFVNMDVLNIEGVEVVHDLNNYPYPFKDDTFDVIYASHVLEHLDDIVKAMTELKRISKKNARVIIKGPHFSCGLAYMDPTHKRVFSYFTFDYFANDSFYDLPKFKILNRKINFTRWEFTSLNKIFNPIVNFNPRIYERLFCWMIPCSEVMFRLEVIK